MVVLEQKWLQSGKVVVFGQTGCFLSRWFYSGKSGFIRTKWLYFDKVVVFGQSGCILAKVVGFVQS